MLFLSHTFFNNFLLIFYQYSSILSAAIRTIFITMKKIPHMPHIMQARCRVCGSLTSFFVKNGSNVDLSDDDVKIYEEITQDEYLDLKRTRLKNRLTALSSHLSKNKTCSTKDKLAIKWIKSFNYENIIIDRRRVSYFYNSTFPTKYLKHIFSTLRIILNAKNEGGKDE